MAESTNWIMRFINSPVGVQGKLLHKRITWEQDMKVQGKNIHEEEQKAKAEFLAKLEAKKLAKSVKPT